MATLAQAAVGEKTGLEDYVHRDERHWPRLEERNFLGLAVAMTVIGLVADAFLGGAISLICNRLADQRIANGRPLQDFDATINITSAAIPAGVVIVPGFLFAAFAEPS